MRWYKKGPWDSLDRCAGKQAIIYVLEDAVRTERRGHFHSTIRFNSLFHRLEVN